MPRRSLLLLFLAAILPLALLSAILGGVALSQQRQAIEQDAATHATLALDRVVRELAAQIDLLDAISSSTLFDPPADPARFAVEGQRLLDRHPLWLALSLSGRDGARVLDLPVPIGGQPGGRVVEVASHARVIDTGRPAIGGVRAGPQGRFAFAIRVPIVRSGAIVGVLSAVTRPDALSDILGAQDIPAAWIGTIVDGEGRLVVRSRGPSDLIGRLAGAPLQAARAKGGAGLYDGITAEDEVTKVAYRVDPGTGWSVHVGIPVAAFRAPLARSIWLMGGGVVASLALAATFLWLLVREARLRRTEARDQDRADRMTALGRMTGGVAHDFNNLLMVIAGHAEILQTRLGIVAPKAERSLEAIRRAVERGTRITHQLLAFSRGAPQRAETIVMADRLEGLLGMIRHALHDGVELELDVAADLPPVRVDPVQLDMALLNLAVNARDAMPGGGQLRVAARRDGDGVAVSVADTGTGISADALPHVFEPFFTTKEVGKGTGLGLSQVYAFAEQSGGTARIDSRPGAGTTVTIRLPIAEEAPPQQVDSLPHRVEAPGGLVVLLVDDNDDVRATTASVLEETGFQVVEAVDAAAGLALIEQRRIDAVVSDIVMPGGMDGLAFAKAVRSRWPGLPLLLVSGYAASVGEAERIGLTVLRKPYAMDDLAQAVRTAWRDTARDRPQ